MAFDTAVSGFGEQVLCLYVDDPDLLIAEFILLFTVTDIVFQRQEIRAQARGGPENQRRTTRKP